jgi:putative transposase
MPRAIRNIHSGLVYHVFNRAVRGVELFDSSGDYSEFLSLMWQARTQHKIRILAYCLMPNHWHLLLWPREDGDLSAFVKWLCGVHAMRWNKSRKTVGRGAVYQSRFKSVVVEREDHLLGVWRYVERNALSAQLAGRAEDWRWGSLWARLRGSEKLDRGPIILPTDWVEFVNLDLRGQTPDKFCLGSDP